MKYLPFDNTGAGRRIILKYIFKNYGRDGLD